MKYLKLIRWPYLLVIALAQIIVKYGLFEPFITSSQKNAIIQVIYPELNVFRFILLILATVLIAAGGYTIQAVFEQSQHKSLAQNLKIGKDQITLKKANNLFFAFNIIGIIIAFYLSNAIGHPSLSVLFIAASFLFYAHSAYLKNYILFRPLISSVLIGFVLLSVGLFDLWPIIADKSRVGLNFQIRQTIIDLFSILIDYSVFIFLTNLVREFIIEQKNINRDYKRGWKSLPLSFGKERTNKVIFFTALLPTCGVIFYITKYLYLSNITLIYSVLFILGPLLYMLFKILSAKQEKDYRHLNLVLKLVLIFCFLSIGLFQFTVL